MVFSYCKCSYHLAGNENAAANFYNTHFVPDGWELVLKTQRMPLHPPEGAL